MDPSCERFAIGGDFNQDTEREHLERYHYAEQFVPGQHVVDIACGTGYGSVLLAKAGAASVQGFDISSDAVAYAKERYEAPNLRFAVGDAMNLSGVASESVDCVISFETIEHLPDVLRYLAEMRRILRPGGRFMVSTPDRRLASTMYPIRRRPNNPFHIQEFTLPEFERLLTPHFQIDEMLGQSFINRALVFWPLQVGVKATCHALRRFGAYRFVRKWYHLGSGFHVQSRPRAGRPIARYWLANCRRSA
jgi:SAM-dependent methyltransferase